MLLKTYVRMRTIMICRKGQSLMEYALLAALIAIALIAVVITFRTTLINKFKEISTKLGKAT
jgi:Flp pilus assembly pilin Flp